MDFTNEINTLESEKLRLEEMLKRPHKIVIYSRRRVGMAAVDLDANTYK